MKTRNVSHIERVVRRIKKKKEVSIRAIQRKGEKKKTEGIGVWT
jgi:hypothetical protein